MVKSYADKVNGYWLGEQAAALGLRMQFERNRDPLMARQLDDAQKSEAERRRAVANENPPSQQNKRNVDKPTRTLKPPAHMRGGQSHAPVPSPDGSTDNSLKAQRDVVFASAAKASARSSPDNAPSLNDGLSRAYNAQSHTPSQNP